MKKYIIPIFGSLLLMSCQKEVLAPEQMIQGKFALDDGTALTSSYLVFDKGHLSTYISESDRPFAEGKIWRVDGDLFTLSSTVSYSITDGVLNTSSTSAPIELKDGILTIGETKYSLLEGLEHEPYSTIVTDREQVFSYTVQDITIPFTVDRPLPNSNLSCSTNTSWITGLAVQEGVIIAHLSSTSTDRDGAISLSYPFADPVVVSIKRRPSTFICLEEDSRTVDYTAQRVVLPYTIDNPVSGSSLTTSVDASWINNIQVSDNEVSFNVTENNSVGSRSAAIALSYEGAPNVTFYVTQEYSAPVITLTPFSQSVDYAGGTFSFDYTITNPREGMTVTAVSQKNWITDVTVSGTTVSYKVAENNSGRARTGTIKLTYGTSNLATASFTVTQTYEAPIIELTPTSNEIDYAGGTFSFDYSIVNPREGVAVSLSVIYDSGSIDWIKDVEISETSVSYRIIENTFYHPRTGRIVLTYSSASREYTITQGNNSAMPLLEGSVDLGLSVMWASCNLGASSPEEYGDYYAWGETSPYYSNLNPLTWKSEKSSGYAWESYSLCNGSSDTITRYYDTVDNKTTFADYNYVDDAARVELGNIWRIPTQEEFSELINNCASEWTTINGKYGRKFTSKKSGYTNKWIFLPAAGLWRGTSPGNNTARGYYWSSSLHTYFHTGAWFVGFDANNVDSSSSYRYYGFSVRPVYD